MSWFGIGFSCLYPDLFYKMLEIFTDYRSYLLHTLFLTVVYPILKYKYEEVLVLGWFK